MLITAVGLAAVLVTAAMLPNQAVHVIRHRNDAERLRGISLASAAIVCSTSTIWACYGLRFDAVWASITALVDFAFQILVVAVVLRHVRIRVVDVSLVLTCGSVLLASALTLPQNALGVIGAGTSMAMFVPQAVRVIRARGTVSGLAFSPVSAAILTAANTLWLVYGILLEDLWLILPCPFSITSGLLILWAWHGSRESVNEVKDRDVTDQPLPSAV